MRVRPEIFAKCAGFVSVPVWLVRFPYSGNGSGHNANADLTDDPERIEWREFYELPRYGMVGVFEGAYMYAEASGVPRRTAA